jgi:RNA-directed DNA polymerase
VTCDQYRTLARGHITRWLQVAPYRSQRSRVVCKTRTSAGSAEFGSNRNTTADLLDIDAAFHWLCHQRRDWPADADIWDLRFRWLTERRAVQQALHRGEYRFEPLSRMTKADGEVLHVWSARDALVLKAMVMVLQDRLPVSKRCTHVKGHGGAKAAVRAVRDRLGDNAFVMRTDVKGYYDNIDQHRMLDRLARYVKDRTVLNLLWQAMRRSVTWGGLYRDCERGISRGCPLSPLLGGFFLHELDVEMARQDVFYVRFMDDILILSPTRWRLRRAVKAVNAGLASLGLDKHPDKTFIGRVEKGFDFLGYHFHPSGLQPAGATWEKFVAHLTRLYEQQRVTRSDAVGTYVRRWLGWLCGGLDNGSDPADLRGLLRYPTDPSELGAAPPHPPHHQQRNCQ